MEGVRRGKGGRKLVGSVSLKSLWMVVPGKTAESQPSGFPEPEPGVK